LRLDGKPAGAELSNGAWLTKSRFLAGRQCVKRLWQQCHLPLDTDNRAAPLSQAGFTVGRLAHQLFPGGVLAWTENSSVSQAADATRASVKMQPPAIFEATIQTDRLLARVDILARAFSGTWDICEVKSSTRVTPEHIDDVAFQLYVARQAGLQIARAEIIHVNKDYILSKGLEPAAYFCRVDVTDEAVERLRDVPHEVEQLLDLIDQSDIPAVDPWKHCRVPHPCEFWDRCTCKKPIDWIYYLPKLGRKRAEMLHQKEIDSIANIPNDIKLTPQQVRVRDVYRTGTPYISSEIAAQLQHFGPPACYLDFETMAPAIPLFEGNQPYQRIPFQWSLHSVDGDGKLRHSGFLAPGGSDPSEAFLRSLLDALDQQPEPIIVYSSFERATLNQLARRFKQHRNRINAVVPRLRDLLNVVRTNVYYPEFRGSYSIKEVGPSMASVQYDDLQEVADGGSAAWAFEKIAAHRCNSDEEIKLRESLIEYCRRDTLAMVEIHKSLASNHSAQ
jgi:predicted RecB family nuclease